MKTLLCAILLMAGLCLAQAPSDASSPVGSTGETASAGSSFQPRNRFSVHPVFTFFTAISPVPWRFPLTFERILSPSRSVVFQPTLVMGSEAASDDNPEVEVFELRGVVGYRFYLGGREPYRWYVGPSVYAATTDLDWKSDARYGAGYASANSFGGLVFLGYVGEGRLIDVDVNLGLGGQYIDGGGKNIRLETGLAPLIDGNIGVILRF